ncbi:hypothetical protein A4X09_0g2308 [Tilletia walkeri]|uniref:Uncharacterized protein n=1 Tax=Tilletia walkeri TaxID=117179 RepID=A0A8X7T773_9BASI|nr:hypothetical protein A4X09_0g2308 [Tilletia walkeri]
MASGHNKRAKVREDVPAETKKGGFVYASNFNAGTSGQRPEWLAASVGLSSTKPLALLHSAVLLYSIRNPMKDLESAVDRVQRLGQKK